MSVKRRTSWGGHVFDLLSIFAILTLIGCGKHGTGSPQIPTKTWEVTLHGLADEAASSVAPTSDGGYLVSGATRAIDSSRQVMWVIKVDSIGRVIWNNPEGQGAASTVLSLPDGGYVLAGSRYPARALGDIFLRRSTPLLDIQWSHSFGGRGIEAARSLRPCPDGGYILAGHTTSFWDGGFDIYIIKTGPDGTEEWERSFGVNLDDWGAGAAPAKDSGFFVTGQSQLGSGEGDFYLIRTNSAGRKIWAKLYGGPKEDRPLAGVPTPDGGYLMCGFTFSYGAGGMDGYVVRADTTGRTVWDQTCGGDRDDWFEAVVSSPDGGFVFAGSTESFGAGGKDIYLVKLNASGHKVWERTFGGLGREMALSVAATPDGGYIVAGATSNFSIGENDIYLIKTDANGEVKAAPDASE